MPTDTMSDVYPCKGFQNQQERCDLFDLFIRDRLDPETATALVLHIRCCGICGLFIDILGMS